MQRSFRSFIKNGKECKKRSVLSLRSFEKNGCLTLDLAQWFKEWGRREDADYGLPGSYPWTQLSGWVSEGGERMQIMASFVLPPSHVE